MVPIPGNWFHLASSIVVWAPNLIFFVHVGICTFVYTCVHAYMYVYLWRSECNLWLCQLLFVAELKHQKRVLNGGGGRAAGDKSWKLVRWTHFHPHMLCIESKMEVR